jgi:hypothetical protein
MSCDRLRLAGVRVRVAVAWVAADPGVCVEALRKRVRQAEVDSGKRADLLASREREGGTIALTIAFAGPLARGGRALGDETLLRLRRL